MQKTLFAEIDPHMAIVAADPEEHQVAGTQVAARHPASLTYLPGGGARYPHAQPRQENPIDQPGTIDAFPR